MKLMMMLNAAPTLTTLSHDLLLLMRQGYLVVVRVEDCSGQATTHATSISAATLLSFLDVMQMLLLLAHQVLRATILLIVLLLSLPWCCCS
jgi:hypothetical protein